MRYSSFVVRLVPLAHRMPCASSPSDQSSPANIYPHTAASELPAWGNLFQTTPPSTLLSRPGPGPGNHPGPRALLIPCPQLHLLPRAMCAMCTPDSHHILEALGLLWLWPLYLWWSLFGASLWLSGKESTCQCKRPRFDPWVRKIPWRREWQFPLQYSDLENPMDRGAWRANSLGSHRFGHDWVTEQLSSLPFLAPLPGSKRAFSMDPPPTPSLPAAESPVLLPPVSAFGTPHIPAVQLCPQLQGNSRVGVLCCLLHLPLYP